MLCPTFTTTVVLCVATITLPAPQLSAVVNADPFEVLDHIPT